MTRIAYFVSFQFIHFFFHDTTRANGGNWMVVRESAPRAKKGSTRQRKSNDTY